MMKHFYITKDQKETVDDWLSKNIGPENFRWWTSPGRQISSPAHVIKYTIEVTEEEEPKLAWFILTHG